MLENRRAGVTFKGDINEDEEGVSLTVEKDGKVLTTASKDVFLVVRYGW